MSAAGSRGYGAENTVRLRLRARSGAVIAKPSVTVITPQPRRKLVMERKGFDNEASADPNYCSIGGRYKPSRGLADHALQRTGEFGRLHGVQFDDKPATTFERNAHDDSTALLGDLHRAVTRPRLHCSHRPPSL